MKVLKISGFIAVAAIFSGCGNQGACPPKMWIAYSADQDGKPGSGIVLSQEGQGTYYMVAADPKPTANLGRRAAGVELNPYMAAADPNAKGLDSLLAETAQGGAIVLVTFHQVKTVRWVDCNDLPKWDGKPAEFPAQKQK